jgi:NAD(P)H-hydrate epimerase
MRGKRVAIICGKGNNGGDGLAIARHALIAGAGVVCALLSPADELSADARAQHNIVATFAPEALVAWDRFDRNARYDAIVDAMLGTGAGGELRGAYREAVAWCNEASAIRLAVDIPTGVSSDTGAVAGEAFAADATATMAALKPGLLLNEGREKSGAISVVSIGAPATLYEGSGIELLDAERATRGMARIDERRNKYDRGKVLVAAGSRGMTGAAVMAAEAALRAGAGLTVLALPERAVATMPQSLAPEIMTLMLPSDEDGAFGEDAFEEIIEKAGSYASMAVGPGLSRSDGSASAVRRLAARWRAPLVLDADGLNAFAGRGGELRERTAPLVITPHHGEMGRLLGVEREEVTRDPLTHARSAAELTGAIVVLKGAPTVVALPGGSLFINGAGNPGMATGGTGDVLTGIVASLMAQGSDPGESTLAAVYLHSLAGDIAAGITGTRSLVATDIIAHIGAAYQELFPQ